MKTTNHVYASIFQNFLKFRPFFCGILSTLFFASCASQTPRIKDRAHVVEISVPEQKMAVYREGKPVKYFPISTSKFGIGDEPGSNRTPLGKFEVAEKIGDKKRAGTVFKSRKPTGEVVKPNSPGRDPIVSRILWLKGLEETNKNAFSRYIYIHGTPEERTIGRPASYGCIRMKSRDVIDLYETIGWGADVYVVNKPLWRPTTPVAPPVEAPPQIPTSLPMAMSGVMPLTENAPEQKKTPIPPPPIPDPVQNSQDVPKKRSFLPLFAGNRQDD